MAREGDGKGCLAEVIGGETVIGEKRLALDVVAGMGACLWGVIQSLVIFDDIEEADVTLDPALATVQPEVGEESGGVDSEDA